MNYGMGGLISSHVDSTNWPDNDQLSSEVNAFGGVRFITFMVYLSDVLSGGHTVFPQLGQKQINYHSARWTANNSKHFG